MTKYSKPSKQNDELMRMMEKQLERIQAEVECQPLVSEAFSLVILETELEDSANFLIKVKTLENDFGKSRFRKVRKDGSCFYRAFIYRLAEILCMGQTFFKQLKIFEKVRNANRVMISAGFEKVVFDDFEAAFVDLLTSISDSKTTILTLPTVLRNKTRFDYCVMYLRMVISSYIQTNQDLFEAYFESKEELKRFCSREVEPIDAEADQIQIMGLFNAFDIPIRIFYVDNGPQEVPTVVSLPETNDSTKEGIFETQDKYLIQLLYRPGHYDIIY
jgi:ubiquitin thioesterase protein OTUB1